MPFPHAVTAARLAAEREAARAGIDGWSHVDEQTVRRNHLRLADMCGGVQPSSPQARDLLARHCPVGSRSRVPSAEADIAMSLVDTEDLETRTFHDGYRPDVLASLGGAMHGQRARRCPFAAVHAGSEVSSSRCTRRLDRKQVQP
jgi:hypothetical protein